MYADNNAVPLGAYEDATIYEFPLPQPAVFEEPLIMPTDGETTPSLCDRLRATCIRTHLVIDTAFRELDEGLDTAESHREKASLKGTAGLAVAGQLYERARLPEVFGVSGTTWVYRESLENGMNSGLATALGALALGVFVYAQQKVIGRNFVRTAVHFPGTYETVNQMWPKTVEAIQDAIPSEKNRIGEAMGMVGLGTTPFIASAKAANPDISERELNRIERRVTRRGSIAAGALAGIVLGAKSSAVHLPARAAEVTVKWSDKIVDIVSSPTVLIAGFGGWAVIKAGFKALSSRIKRPIQA